MNHESEKNEEETRSGSFEKIHGISEKKKEREGGAETEKQGRKKKKDEKRWQKEGGRKKEKNAISPGVKAGRKTEKKKFKRDNVLYLLNDQPSSGGRPCSTKSVENDPIAVDKSFDSFCNKRFLRDFASIPLSCEAIRQLTDRLENAISKFELLANAFAQMGLIVHSSDGADGANNIGASDLTQAETLNLHDDFFPIVMQNETDAALTTH